MMHHMIRSLALMVIPPLAIAAASCQRKCGDMDVPYPFGIHGDGPHCYLNETYAVSCDRSRTPPVPELLGAGSNTYRYSLNGHGPSIYNISVEHHELRVPTFYLMNYKTSYLRNYDRASYATFQSTMNVSRGMQPHFPISSTKNVFTALGCDIYAVLYKVPFHWNDPYADDFARGCLTTCTGLKTMVKGSCSGIGCCQTSILKNAYFFNITVSSYTSRIPESGSTYFRWAFLVANDSFRFSTEYLSNFDIENYSVPMIRDWSVGDRNCTEAKMNTTSYMCKENSTCSDDDNGMGYRCRCREGYKGNPYLSEDGGCQDIDECKNTTGPCVKIARCTNTLGSFTCSCPHRYYGDGRKEGSGCSKKPKEKLSIKDIALGISTSVSFILLICSGLYCGLRQRKIVMQREKFFQQNGGLMLLKLIAAHKCSRETTIFTDEELKKATNNYHESTLLGQGGHGTVYKGELNNKIVAIKKSKFVDQRQVKEFINEVIILTQINHKNVVKLIGCCLEKEVPLLVYEFITHGTLFDHLHKLGHHAHMSWRSRLRIAIETAGALSYLHSDATTQVIHRDIKTANILLDENFTAKIADFGASRLVSVEQAQDLTFVQGTVGYLDPEYLKELELTDKSDVYSFGVVLAEILTGMEVLSSTRPEEQKSLSKYFVSKYEEGNLLDIIDRRIFDDIYVKQFIEVAKLAIKCLRMSGKERPSMKEVLMELERVVRTMERHSWVENNHDEKEHLLIEETIEYSGTTASSSIPYDIIKDQVAFQIESGR